MGGLPPIAVEALEALPGDALAEGRRAKGARIRRLAERLPFRLVRRLPILLLVASSLAALLAAEGLTRLLWPQWSDQWKMWRPDPTYARGLRPDVREAVVHGHSGEFAFRFSTNRQGLRMDRELEPSPRAGWRRALFVGDSFTFGYGVEQGEAFADRLQERFDARGARIEAVNAGFASGFTLDTQYLFTRQVGGDWGPSWVVAGVCLSNDLSDLGETVWRVADGELEGLAKKNDWVPLVARRSGLVNWIVKGAVPALRRSASGQRPPAPGREPDCTRPGPAPASRPPRDVEIAPRRPSEAEARSWTREERVLWVLEAWRQEARTRDYELVLLLIPDAEEVQRPTEPSRLARHAAVRGTFAEAAARVGVRVLDPVGDMRRHWCETREPLYFDVDGHWNAAGHRFAAEWLDRELFAEAPPG